MLVLPLVATVATASSQAQAADEMEAESSCLECAGIGIVPCELC
jgi:hypothetical protein